MITTLPTDDSGIEGPSSPLTLEAKGPTIAPPGAYEFALSKFTIDPDDDKEDEAPLGPVAKVTVPAGFYPRVRPPRDYRNWLSNPDTIARGNDAARNPEGWQRYTVAGVTSLEAAPGVQYWQDSSNSTGNADLTVTDPFDLSGVTSLIARFMMILPDYISGAVDLIFKQVLPNATVIETLLGTADNGDLKDIIKTLGVPGTPDVDYNTLNPAGGTGQLLLRLIGSRGTGKRNFKLKAFNPIVMPGRSLPNIRLSKRQQNLWNLLQLSGLDLGDFGFGDFDFDDFTDFWEMLCRLLKLCPPLPPVVSPPVEPPSIPYPTFGYTTVVGNPPNSQRPILDAEAGTLVPGNFVEFYAPNGFPVNSSFFMRGMQLYVKPQEQRNLSFYFWWRGVDQPATPLKVLLKDVKDRVIADLGTFRGMQGVTGSSKNWSDADAHGWVRRDLPFNVPLSGTADRRASYIEIVSGGVGDGLFRVMAGQFEEGLYMTEFSDNFPSEGSISTVFDTAITGVPRGTLPTLEGFKTPVRIGAEVSQATNGATSHVVHARSKNYADEDFGPWVLDINDLDPNKIELVEVRTTCFTNDENVSPHFHSHFFDFRRQMDSYAPYAFGQFLRADGTEFDGTVTVYNFPPIRSQKNILQEEYADNSRGFANMGVTTKWARGFGIEARFNYVAEEIMALVGLEGREGQEQEDASVFVAEIHGKWYRLRILDMDIQPENREAHDVIEGMEYEGRWNLIAEGLEGEVLGEAPF